MTTIAYLGPPKTNTHFAALRKFGLGKEYKHAPTIDDVFEMVERGKADYGVVPVENSLEGAVTHTLDRFIDFLNTPVHIQGETEETIKHYLILHSRASLGQIEVVFSHPQAFAQCRVWLQKHLHQACLLETSSTAEAVHSVLTKRILWSVPSGSFGARRKIEPKERAAIARIELVKEHPGKLRAIPITDERDNRTRFLILGLKKPEKKGHKNKTSIVFALKDRPGALHGALMPFKRNRINLTKIESRPSKKKAWEYLFFVDIEGHVSEPRINNALLALQRRSAFFRILGSYPI